VIGPKKQVVKFRASVPLIGPIAKRSLNMRDEKLQSDEVKVGYIRDVVCDMYTHTNSLTVTQALERYQVYSQNYVNYNR